MLPIASGVRGRSVNLLAILALLVFFASIGFATYVFFYKSHLIKTIADLDASLVLARKSFDPEFIALASRLDARLESARKLMNSHRAFSPLFDILEKRTLEDVRFKDFLFNVAEGREPTFSMEGQAKSFNAVALQSDIFGAERSFTDPVFSNFSLDEEGNVIFNFQTTLDPKLLLYRETLISVKEEGVEETAPTLENDNI